MYGRLFESNFRKKNYFYNINHVMKQVNCGNILHTTM